MIFEFLYRIVQNCTVLYRIVQQKCSQNLKILGYLTKKSWNRNNMSSNIFPVPAIVPEQIFETPSGKWCFRGAKSRNFEDFRGFLYRIRFCTILYNVVRNQVCSQNAEIWHDAATFKIPDRARVTISNTTLWHTTRKNSTHLIKLSPSLYRIVQNCTVLYRITCFFVVQKINKKYENKIIIFFRVLGTVAAMYFSQAHAGPMEYNPLSFLQQLSENHFRWLYRIVQNSVSLYRISIESLQAVRYPIRIERRPLSPVSGRQER